MTPILKLPKDVFREILLWVTEPKDLYDTGQLESLRVASQVCASWRALILASSSLWAKVIVFPELGRKTDAWRSEVLRRTGQSFLHVRGYNMGEEEATQFLIFLFENHWTRIRKLDIDIQLDCGPPTLVETISCAFQRPSPNLEYFQASIWGHSEADPEELFFTKSRAFSDEAPSLRYFDAERVRLSSCPLPNWMSQLRSLRFTCPFTAGELLGALTSMPLLESLKLYSSALYIKNQTNLVDGRATSLVKTSNLPRPGLPRLQRIDIETCDELEFVESIAVLDHIYPASSCFLRFRVDNLKPTPRNVSAVTRTLAKYHGLMPELRDPYDNLDLRFGKKTIHFQSDSVNLDYEERFDVAVSFREDLDIVCNFCDSSLWQMLNKVHKLHLYDISPSPTGPDISRPFSSLTSTKELVTDHSSLRNILDLPYIDHTKLFPSLKTLNFVDMSSSYTSFVHAFLLHRKWLGLSISTFQLGMFRPNTVGDLTVLDDVVGLRVEWRSDGWRDESRDYHYICGSGNPSSLNFGEISELA